MGTLAVALVLFFAIPFICVVLNAICENIGISIVLFAFFGLCFIIADVITGA